MSVSVEISTLRSKGEYHFGQETWGGTDSLLNQLHFLDKTASSIPFSGSLRSTQGASRVPKKRASSNLYNVNRNYCILQELVKRPFRLSLTGPLIRTRFHVGATRAVGETKADFFDRLALISMILHGIADGCKGLQHTPKVVTSG